MYTDIDLESIYYKEPVTNSRGGLTVYLDTNKTNKRNPRVQFAKMRAPFGVSDRFDDNPTGRKNLELSVEDPSQLEWLTKFDTQNVTKAAENSVKWFKSEIPAEELKNHLYRPSAKMHPEDKFPPLVRVKISTESKPTNIYIVYKDGTGKERYRRGDTSEITRDSMVTAIVDIGGLWFVQRGFGTTFLATDLLVWPNDEDSGAFPFLAGAGLTLPTAEEETGEVEPEAEQAPDIQ